MESPGPTSDVPPKLTGVIFTGDSFGTSANDVEPTTSGCQTGDRSHLKRKSSEGVRRLVELELPNREEDRVSDEEDSWEEDDGDEISELLLANGMPQDDYTEATGNVDDILNILGVQDSPPPQKKRGRKRATDDGENGCSDRSVLLDTDQIEGANGFLWDTVPHRRDSLFQENSRSFDPGPTSEALNVTDPLECFKLFITDQMMDDIISATNGFIDEETNKQTRRSRDCHFQPVASEEFSALLGLLILSGALQNNRLRTELLFDSTFSGDHFRATMPCSRFNILLNVLAFENSAVIKRNTQDKFTPISKLWNSFLRNCSKHYVPSSHVTIGKQIVPFRGHGCPFIVTTHSPVRHGIQFYLMVDNSSKYLVNASVYLGRSSLPKDCTVENFAVDCLVEPIRDSGRNITMDEWFTSISLAEELLSAKLTMIGQIKTTKKELPEFFSDFKYKHRKSGSSIFLHAGNVTAVSYKPCNNTGVVSLISTCHDGMALVNSSGKPQIVLDYEATRGAVEAFESNCSKMTTNRKTHRWPLAVFYHMIDMAIQNSYIMYYHNFSNNPEDPKTKVLSKMNFALSLVRQLCSPWMRARLHTAIPSALRSIICHCLGINTAKDHKSDDSYEIIEPFVANSCKPLGFTFDKDQLVLDDKSRQQCSFCPSKARRKTRWLCGICRKTICIEHSRRMCVPCWGKIKRRSAETPVNM